MFHNSGVDEAVILLCEVLAGVTHVAAFTWELSKGT